MRKWMLTIIIPALVSAEVSATPEGDRIRALVKQNESWFEQNEKEKRHSLGWASGGEMSFLSQAWTSSLLGQTNESHSAICSEWTDIVVQKRLDQRRLPALEGHADAEMTRDYSAAVDAVRTLLENEELVKRHPAFSAEERKRLLRISAAQDRQRAASVFLCDLLQSGAVSSRRNIYRTLGGELLAYSQSLATKISSNMELDDRLVEAGTGLFLKDLQENPPIKRSDARAMIDRNKAQRRTSLAAVEEMLAPGRSPMEVVVRPGPALQRYFLLNAEQERDVVRVLGQSNVRNDDDKVRFLMHYLIGHPGNYARSALLRAEGGDRVAAVAALVDLLATYTGTLRYQRAGRERDYDLLDQSMRVIDEALSAWSNGNHASGVLYAALPPGRTAVEAWRRGGWGLWEWMSAARVNELKTSGRIVERNGQMWIAAVPSRHDGDLELPARAVVIALDLNALAAGKPVLTSWTANNVPIFGETMNDARNRYLIGDALQRGKRSARAMPHLLNAAQALPDDPYVFMSLGYAAYSERRYTEAADALERAVALEGRALDTNGMIVLAFSQAVLGRHRESLAMLDRVIATHPGDAASRDLRAAVSFAIDGGPGESNIDKLDQYRRTYSNLAENAKYGNARYGELFNRGYELAAVRRLLALLRDEGQRRWAEQEAETVINRLTTLYRAVPAKPAPTNAAVQFSREAEAAIANRTLYGAVIAYSKAIDAAPWWAGAYRNIALVYGAMGGDERAAELMSVFLAFEPLGPQSEEAKTRIARWQAKAREMRARGGSYHRDSGLVITPDREGF